jgi:hypothetical protein
MHYVLYSIVLAREDISLYIVIRRQMLRKWLSQTSDEPNMHLRN